MYNNLTNSTVGSYTIGKKIAETYHSIVYEAKKANSEQKCAIKIFKSKTRTSKSIDNELRLIIDIQNDYIIPIYEVFIQKQYNFTSIVMPFALGGNLQDFIQKNGPLPECIAAQVIYSILSALQCLHFGNILHRKYLHGNIIPENILIMNNDIQKLDVVLSGFENAKFFMEGEKMNNYYIGTFPYNAPEIHQQKEYDEKIDIWSTGVVMYNILCGNVSSSNYNDERFYEALVRGNLSFDRSYSHISAEAKDLLKLMLKVNPDERISAAGALEHYWIKQCSSYLEKELKQAFKEASEFVDIDIIEYSASSSYLHSQINVIEVNETECHENNLNLCVSCNQTIVNENDCLFISGFKYHSNCIKCAICNKNLRKNDDLDNFVCVTPGLFFCQEDYDKYKSSKKSSLPKPVLNEYREKMVKNSIKLIFQPFILNGNHSPGNLFIEQDMIKNSYHLNENFDYFVPTIKFHFDLPLSKFKINEFIKKLPSDMVISNIERGSTLITIAVILNDEIQQTKQQINDNMTSFVDLIKTTLGNSIVGSLIGEPIINIPTYSDTVQFFKNDYVNLLQNFEILDNIDVESIRKEVNKILSYQNKKNLDFIFEHKELFEKMEEQVRQRIKSNGIEVIIIGETIIASQNYDKYNDIKNKIIKKGKEVDENILFHGTKLSNHKNIIEKNFTMPGEKDYQGKDDGYFGRGIYATENIVYASIYSNDYSLIKFNEAISVIGCQSICCKDEIVDIENMDSEGFDIDEHVKKEYGIHRAFVGSKNNFHCINEDEIDDNLIVAYEFVFPNKFQIFPVCSFTILRTNFFVLWVDEKGEYSNLSNEIKEKINENVYYSNSIEEALEIIDNKKLNKIKLIVSFDDENWGNELIDKAREIIESNFVCLVFSKTKNQVEFSTELENVLFTNDFDDLKRFTQINLMKENILEFIDDLKSKFEVNFEINDRYLLKFYESYPKKKPKQSVSKNKKEIICTSCQKRIKENELFNYHGFEYHKNCMKCSVCQKEIDLNKISEDFICLTPGLFICKKEYDEYLDNKSLPENVMKEYTEKMIRNSINELFRPIVTNNDLISDEMIENSYQLNKNFKYFVPTVTFHFNISPDQIKMNELIKILPKEMIIVYIEKGSTILTLAFILTEEFRNEESKYKEIIEKLKSEIINPLNKSIVGTFSKSPVLEMPSKQTIKKFFSKKSINLLQNTNILEGIDFDKIKNEVKQKLDLQQNKNKNLLYVYENIELFESLERQIRINIKENPNELTVVGETIIANNNISQYDEIKKKLIEKIGNKEQIKEVFLYQGNCIYNQPSIIQDHYYGPERTDIIRLDKGYLGQGIYVTDNIFYSTLYSNDYSLLNDKQKVSIFCCRTFYNDKKIIKIKNENFKDFRGKPISDDVINNHGVHSAFVASVEGFIPFNEKGDYQLESCLISANEFAFPHGFQVVPICSLAVMKPEYYILWVDGTERFANICNELRSYVEENIYYETSIEEAAEFAFLKQRNKIKLILSFDSIDQCKDCFDIISEIYYTNNYNEQIEIYNRSKSDSIIPGFICLIFTDNEDLTTITNEINMENVLITNEFDFLLEFAEVILNIDKISDFTHKLNEKHNIELTINKKSLLNFDNYKSKFLFHPKNVE